VADIVDPATRSRMMSGIRGKDTLPELRLRRALHRRGLRFRLQRKDLPGRPDIVFPSRKAVVFVHGCFWHRHKGCRFATTPATRPEFWSEKFHSNQERDVRNIKQLRSIDWHACVIWECAIRKDVDGEADRVVNWLERLDRNG
jgi:DNA mismatch endonuclease (patch repair protein)